MISGLFALISRSVCIGMSHRMVHSSFSVTVLGLCLYHFSVAVDCNVCRCSNACMPLLYHTCASTHLWLVLDNLRLWSTLSSQLWHIRHFGSEPFFIILCWYNFVGKLWSCAAMMKPSVSAFSPEFLNHWWVLSWFMSGLPTLSGYWPCIGLPSHLSLSFSSAFCFAVDFYPLCIICYWLILFSGMIRHSKLCSKLPCFFVYWVQLLLFFMLVHKFQKAVICVFKVGVQSYSWCLIYCFQLCKTSSLLRFLGHITDLHLPLGDASFHTWGASLFCIHFPYFWHLPNDHIETIRNYRYCKSGNCLNAIGCIEFTF